MRTLLLAAMIAFLSGCARRELGKPVMVERAGYVYVQVGADYEVLVKSQQALRDAMADICGSNICTIKPVGEMYLLRVEAK